MSRLDTISDHTLRLASSVGDSLRGAMPSKAGTLLGAGMKLGAAKGGLRAAKFFARRHPALLVATAAGAGLLWYAARRKARQAQDAPIEGDARRVEARRSNGSSTARKSTRRSRSAAATTPSSD
mgnify:CR=1 FL=1